MMSESVQLGLFDAPAPTPVEDWARQVGQLDPVGAAAIREFGHIEPDRDCEHREVVWLWPDGSWEGHRHRWYVGLKRCLDCGALGV